MVFILEDPLKGIETLKSKLKEFGAVAGFKVNKQKTKMLTKNMSSQEQIKLTKTRVFQIEIKGEMFGNRINKYELHVISQQLC